MKYEAWIYHDDDITQLDDTSFLVILESVSEEDAITLARLMRKYDRYIALFPMNE